MIFDDSWLFLYEARGNFMKAFFQNLKECRELYNSLYRKCESYQKAQEKGCEETKIEFSSMEIWYFTNRLYLYRKITISPRKRFILQTGIQYFEQKPLSEMTKEEIYAIKFMEFH